MPSINPQAIRGPVTAVPVVAGTGVRFVEDVPNNRVVAEVDETVLWSGTAGVASDTLTLTEAYSNFEKIEIYANGVYQSTSTIYTFAIVSGVTDFRISNMSFDGTDTYEWVCRIAIDSTTGFSVGSSLILKQAYAGSSRSSSNASTTGNFSIAIKKIVGINRIASN